MTDTRAAAELAELLVGAGGEALVAHLCRLGDDDAVAIRLLAPTSTRVQDRLDGEIDAYARSLPGFDRVEKWLSPEGDVVNAMYYFADRMSVAMLGRFPQHREAKAGVGRWYDGYRIVVSDVRATYGDGRLPAPPGASQPV